MSLARYTWVALSFKRRHDLERGRPLFPGLTSGQESSPLPKLGN